MPFEKSVADVHFIRGEYEKAKDMYLEGAREGVEIASFDYAYCLLHGAPCIGSTVLTTKLPRKVPY